MSAGWGISVRKSRLTGHWIINHGEPDAEGFRHWEAAMAEADRRAERRRVYLRWRQESLADWKRRYEENGEG